MNATITDVFEVCCKAVGFPFHPRRGRMICPFHGGSRQTLSINDSLSAWHCFNASCPHPKGGFFDVPIAFGLVATRSEASHWLYDRKLIAPPEKNAEIHRVIEPKRLRKVNPFELPEPQRSVYREAHIDLQQAIGFEHWRELRILNFPYHYRRHEALTKKHEMLSALIVKLSYDEDQRIAHINDQVNYSDPLLDFLYERALRILLDDVMRQPTEDEILAAKIQANLDFESIPS